MSRTRTMQLEGAHRRARAVCLALVVFLAAGVLRADVIQLKSGGTVEGKIVRETDTEVHVRIRGGEIVVRRADILSIEKKETAAEVLERRRGELPPEDIEGLIGLAEEAAKADEDDLACAWLREARADAPGRVEILDALRRLLDPPAFDAWRHARRQIDSGEADAAEETVRSLRAAYPEASPASAARRWLAERREAAGDRAEALRLWEEERAYLPSDPQVLLPLARLRLALGDRAAARTLAEQLQASERTLPPPAAQMEALLRRVQEPPKDPTPRDQLDAAADYRTLDLLPEARAALAKALEGAGPDADLLEEIAGASEDLDPALADQAWDRVAETGDPKRVARAQEHRRRLREVLFRRTYADLLDAEHEPDLEVLLHVEDLVAEAFRASEADDPADRIEKILEAGQGLDYAWFEAFLRRGVRFPPATPGTSRRRIRLSHDGTTVEYTLYVPPQYDPSREWPLYVALHGTSGSGRNYVSVWQREADRYGYLVAAPTAVANIGFGVAATGQFQVIETIKDVLRNYNVDPERVVLDGMSMGAHAAWYIGAHYPDRLAAIIPRSGAPHLAMDFLENLISCPVYSCNGTSDTLVGIDHVRQGSERMEKLGVPHEAREFEDRGHEVFLEENDRIAAWLADRRRPSYPQRVVLHTVESLHRRVYWVEVKEAERYAANLVHIGGADGSEIEMREVNAYPSVVRANYRGGNLFEVRVENVRRLRVFLSDRMVDFGKPVRVKVGSSRAQEIRVAPEARRMLEMTLHRADRKMIYSTWIEVRVSR